MRASEEQEAQIAIVLLNNSGNFLGGISHPKAAPMATKVADAKAFTALNFGKATDDLQSNLEAETQSKLAATNNRLLFLGGGVPVKDLSEIVGAIGVSGATPEHDSAIAKEVLASLVRL